MKALDPWGYDGVPSRVAGAGCGAESLSEVNRLPMRKPSGKYNVFDKIRLCEGTSH